MRHGIFILLLVSTGWANAQLRLTGTLADSTSRQPIPFANLTLADGRSGCTTDIDGAFSLTVPAGYTGVVYLSHISYQHRAVTVDYLKQHATIFLRPSSTELRELTITTERGENPAFRIIRQAIAHKREHEPSRLASYRYTSYNKLLITFTSPQQPNDSIEARISKIKDTTRRAKAHRRFNTFDSLLGKTHFFMSESVTQKEVSNPGREKEKLIALQVSGFKSPLFTNVATDYQPFSFYDDNISLLGKDFVNPLSKGTFSRYDFKLADTTYSGTDTVFIIRYQPRARSYFNGLKGILSISTDGFAVKNVIAASADSLALMGIRIRQNYEKTDGHWFPTQLNTDIHFYEYKAFGRHIIAQHRSFLSDISINPSLPSSNFNDVKVDLSLPDPKLNLPTLERYRRSPLDQKETRTLTYVDSLTRKVRWLDGFINAFATQAIPLGPIEFDMNQFVHANQFENIRAGVGIHTSPAVSKWFRVGGYAGYGFHDDRWKYGGDLRVVLNESQDIFLRLSYAKDIYEVGTSQRQRDGQLIGTESFRDLVASRFDRTEGMKVEIGSRIAPDVHVVTYVSRAQITPTYPYQLKLISGKLSTFNIAEAGINFRYVRDEKYMKLNHHTVFLGQRFPVATLGVTFGGDKWDGSSVYYSRVDFSFKHLWHHRGGSKTRIFLAAGLIEGTAPYGKLYTGRGTVGPGNAGYVVDDYFQTMGLYEFTASKFASLFLQHNFGNVLLNKKYSKPELILYHHAGVGQLDNANMHLLVNTNSFDRSYFEGGLGLNNIIRGNYARFAYWGLGGGVFYRYGAYRFQSTSDNTVARFLFTVSF